MHVKIINGNPVKYTIKQLRQDNPNSSFGRLISEEVLASYDVYSCTVQYVDYDRLAQTSVEGQFVQVDGQWTLFMVAENLAAEQAEANIRSNRDDLLQETDWIVIKSYERSQNIPAEWELYRQGLRDITGQSGFPFSVTWPIKP